MSAHVKLATSAAAQAAMAKLLRRLGREDLKDAVALESFDLRGGARYYVDFPVSEKPGHYAQIWASCDPGKPARVGAAFLSPVKKGEPGCWREIGGRDVWCNSERLFTPRGFMRMAVDTLAPMLLVLMNGKAQA